jgi:hypothetical protein
MFCSPLRLFLAKGLYRFLAIAVLLDVKDIPQVGPLQWGQISDARKMPITDGIFDTRFGQ